MIQFKIHTIAFILILSASASTAAEQKLDGWQNTKWGMSKSQVQKAVPEAKDYTYYSNGKPFDLFGFSDYGIGDCKFRASFVFKNDKLKSVHLDLSNERDIYCAGSVINLLSDKYGPAVSDDTQRSAGGKVRKALWFIGRTRINVLDFYFPALGTTVMSLIYSDRQSDDGDKL